MAWHAPGMPSTGCEVQYSSVQKIYMSEAG